MLGQKDSSGELQFLNTLQSKSPQTWTVVGPKDAKQVFGVPLDVKKDRWWSLELVKILKFDVLES